MARARRQHDRPDRYRHRTFCHPQTRRAHARYHAGRDGGGPHAEVEGRQRPAQSLGTRLPVAETAGEGRLLNHRGNRRRREHQSVLYQQSLTPDIADAGDRGGDTGWNSACWIDKGKGDEAVSINMDRSERLFLMGKHRTGFGPLVLLMSTNEAVIYTLSKSTA